MADILEDDNFGDKLIDYVTFKNNQLNLFKHDYREAVASADDQAYKVGFDAGFKACKILSRKLGRLKGTLTAIRSSGRRPEISKNLERMESTCEEILSKLFNLKSSNSHSSDDSSEFSLDFARSNLPDFNPGDMEFLLDGGVQGNSDGGHILEMLHDKREEVAKSFSNEVSQNEVECNKLFEQCSPILRDIGICDQFLYST